jgi:hypothetical protein
MSRSEETYTQTTTTNTALAWIEYQNTGTVRNDEVLVAMLHEVIDTIHSLDKIYAGKAALMVRAMIADYQALDGMAFHRNLPNIPTLAR